MYVYTQLDYFIIIISISWEYSNKISGKNQQSYPSKIQCYM